MIVRAKEAVGPVVVIFNWPGAGVALIEIDLATNSLACQP